MLTRMAGERHTQTRAALPEDFVGLMHEHYDSATADALCLALDTTSPDVSIRINPWKLSGEAVLSAHPEWEPVPWCPDAFFLPERPPFTFDPLLHAGAYYVQEAASMYVAQLLAPHIQAGEACPLLAIDLCAAPGGKSTLLHSLLPEGSLLVCNEPVKARSQILAENMQKWTRGLPASAPHVIVTQCRPDAFGMLAGQADILLTDVPCSGEGMFRKDDVARQEWSMENVMMCQKRQRDILDDIWPTLRPGGLLVYSTCTFNRLEDEDNARWICRELGGELLSEHHFLPGRDRGEGFYAAAIVKGQETRNGKGQERTPPTERAEKIAQLLKSLNNALAPCPQPIAPCPSPLAPCPSPRIELSYDDALRYLRREALRVEAPHGLVTLCYRGLELGQGKSVAGRINNLYPEQWRIRTTYTTPFSLLPTP